MDLQNRHFRGKIQLDNITRKQNSNSDVMNKKKLLNVHLDSYVPCILLHNRKQYLTLDNLTYHRLHVVLSSNQILTIWYIPYTTYLAFSIYRDIKIKHGIYSSSVIIICCDIYWLLCLYVFYRCLFDLEIIKTERTFIHMFLCNTYIKTNKA